MASLPPGAAPSQLTPLPAILPDFPLDPSQSVAHAVLIYNRYGVSAPLRASKVRTATSSSGEKTLGACEHR
jgi:hypothetical protein